MDLFTTKLLFIVVVLLTGLFGASLPWLTGERAWKARFLALGDTFSGGVLGGAGLLHLLDHGIAGFEKVLPGLHYPIAEMLTGLGFLLMLFLEGVVAGSYLRRKQDQGQAGIAGAYELAPALSKDHTSAFVLLLVLSVHSLVAGLALGAQRSIYQSLIVFVAILAHKSVAGFALGVGFHRAGFSRSRAMPVIGLFSIMTPLGILIGSAADEQLSNGGAIYFEAIFNSLAAGTFIYIAALDIIRNEFDAGQDRWQKWLLAVAGFSIMAVLAYWI